MFNKILAPLDGSTRSEAILPYVEELAACHESIVYLIEVIEPIPILVETHASMVTAQMEELKIREQDARAYLTARVGEFRARGISAQMRVLHGPVAEAICQQAELINADLIAMATHGRSELGQLVFGSVASATLRHSHIPLLLIRAG